MARSSSTPTSTGIATGHCNDMVVGPLGNAYVGNFGFDFEGGESPASATLAIVWADGTVTAAADDLLFPNGSVITADGSTLIVGESMGARYTAFTITHDRGLTERRVWAEVPGMAPDGCTIDADGAIWFADALGKQVVRVLEGGEITHRIPTPDNVYACMLGGPDGRTLFALTAAGSHPDVVAGTATGALWQRPGRRPPHPHFPPLSLSAPPFHAAQRPSARNLVRVSR